ncbi:alpha/beta fold hydrolase [Roseomonas chloroacetimidivorans]|uniref:alpha/beta fold hydrolase n=1 Tax=Roseomonas chloroacetimidivorans TaxID=1766656 RepID=UPI003C7652A2
MADLHELVARAGANDLAYTDPSFPDRPMMLRSACPRGIGPETRVVFAYHGAARNGWDYRDFWLPFVDEANLLVIAPEFPHETFPGTGLYNFGAVTEEDGTPRPRATWSYAIHRRLFADLRAAGIVRCRGYGLFGHSAGGQVVQRLISLGQQEDVEVAIAANAGTYGMPQLDVAYPYGLGGLGLTENDLRRAFAFPLTIMAGTEDTDASGPAFPNEPEAMAQGEHRYARAQRCLAIAREQAARLSTPCRWRLLDVPGVGHHGAEITASAARVMAAELPQFQVAPA